MLFHKKNSALFIVLILFSSSLLSASQEKETKQYFKHLAFKESPYAKFVGIHKISQTQAKNYNNYAITLDFLGRLKSIEYNRSGQLLTTVVDNWDNFFWNVPKINYEYNTDEVTVTYYDASNKRMTGFGEVYEERYKLDEQGRRVELSYFDKEGNPSQSMYQVHKYQWQHTEKGLFEKRFNLKGELTTMRPNLGFYETKLTYNAKGLITRLTNYGKDHKIINNSTGVAMDKLFYDQEDNFIRWQVYDLDEKATSGNYPGVHMGEHLYDNHGNKVITRHFTENGNLDFHKRYGTDQVKRDYDQYGNLILEKIVGFEVNPTMLTTVIVQNQYIYDELGYFKLWSNYLDGKGKLKSHPIAAIRQHIYKEGVFSHIDYFDVNMKKKKAP